MPVCEAFLELTGPFGVRRSAMQPAFGMAEAGFHPFKSKLKRKPTGQRHKMY